ncbi:unnamed protein product [Nezara viridula]|uniref:Uncharacterized protein n=1 Tax=Nezara viridula TaxID=85310 RepID=A0A9P0E330_NEZVI|nr:unnamed protein product [Nezara viridula]
MDGLLWGAFHAQSRGEIEKVCGILFKVWGLAFVEKFARITRCSVNIRIYLADMEAHWHSRCPPQIQLPDPTSAPLVLISQRRFWTSWPPKRRRPVGSRMICYRYPFLGRLVLLGNRLPRTSGRSLRRRPCHEVPYVTRDRRAAVNGPLSMPALHTHRELVFRPCCLR